MRPRQQRIFEPTLFKEYLRSKMIALLQSIAGKKMFMFDVAVSTPIDLIVDKNMLIQHGIPANGGVANFQAVQLDPNFDQIVILLIPTPKNLKKLRDLIVMNIEKVQRKFYPVFWPKRTMAVKEFFKGQNLLGYMDIKDFAFDLLPLDIDLYSLQMKCIKDLYVDHDYSIYTTVAESIHRLQCVFGKIHNILYKGKASKAVYDILRLKQHEIKVEINYGDIQSIIILDRAVDFLTPLLMQTTYEGMIDQFFGINGGVTRIPSALYQQAKQKQSSNAYKNIGLNSQKDFLYEQLRYLSIFGARTVLKTKAAEFDQFVNEAGQLKDIKEKAIATQRIKIERQYFKKHVKLIQICLEQIKTISFHKELILQQECLKEESKGIIEYFQNLIAFEGPLQKILRAMCIQSIVDKGVYRKIYPKICEDIVYTYGSEHLVSLSNLAKLGLFFQQGSYDKPFPFSQIKKQLKLISDNPIKHESPTQTSFAYGGYTPILTKIVQAALKGGWKPIYKILKNLLPGQFGMPDVMKQCTSHPKPAIVVYFIGGVTYGEIQTIRLLGKFIKRQIIIATTEVINGDKLIRSLIEESQ